VETANGSPTRQKRTAPETEQEAMPRQTLTSISQQETSPVEPVDQSIVDQAAITPNVNSLTAVANQPNVPTLATEWIIAHAANPAILLPLANPVTPVI